MGTYRHELLSSPPLEWWGEKAGIRPVGYLRELFAAPPAVPVDSFGNRRDQRTRPTPEGIQLAQDVYASCHQSLREVITAYATRYGMQDDIAGMIRGQDDVRVTLGVMLLDELDRLAAEGGLPERVQYQEILKQINFSGYPDKVESREVAALIGLSLLDGTFRPVKGGDEIVVDAGGEVLQGQHRAAAMMALGVWGQSSVAERGGYR